MTVTYDDAEAERLIAEAREDDARLVPPPWTAHAHGSMGPDYFVLTRSDGDHDLLEKNDALGIARTRNNLRALADQLEAIRVEMRRRTEEWGDAESEVDRLRAMERRLQEWAGQLDATRDQPGAVGPFISAELRNRMTVPAGATPPSSSSAAGTPPPPALR